jgi:TPR repeat protein/serine/threonine protein kinase
MHIVNGQKFGPFTIVSSLGSGGMASVYLAYQARLDRQVALKVLPPELLTGQGFVERFEREAKLIARLEHRHIVPVYDYGIESDLPWMALRLVRGGHLGDYIEKTSDTAVGLSYFAMIADALDYAHSQGIIHRDLKPQNVLVSDRGELYLADFGIARLLGGGTILTQKGDFLGTPAYMAPEQVKFEALGSATDIYALGIMAYQWLTGVLPFRGDIPLAVMRKHADELPPLKPLERLPERARWVILRALEKEPQDRWPAAARFVAELEAALTGTGVASANDAAPTGAPPTIQWMPSKSLEQRPTEPPASRSQRPTADIDRTKLLDAASANDAARTVALPVTRSASMKSSEQAPTEALDTRSQRSRTDTSRKKLSTSRAAALAILVAALGAAGVYFYESLWSTNSDPTTPVQIAKPGAEAIKEPSPVAPPIAPDQEAQTSVAPAPPTTGALLISTDAACTLSIDDKASGTLTPSEPMPHTLALGEHLLLCTSTSRPAIFEKRTPVVTAGQQTTVAFTLAAGLAEAQKSEDDRKAEEKRLAESTREVQTSVARPVPTTGALLVSTDAACALSIDDKASGILKPSKPMSQTLAVGKHVLLCTSTSRSTIFEERTTAVTADQQATVAFTLATGLAEAQKAEDDRNAEKERLAEKAKHAEAQAREAERIAKADLDPVVQFNRGSAYFNGEGVPRDFQQAMHWFRKAAEQGHKVAQFNLGVMYGSGQGAPKDDQQAAFWTRKAAEQGYADAQQNLGTMYGKGQGVPNDNVQALSWFQKAAEQGQVEAQAVLGVMYSNGRGVPRDDQQAAFWARKAAEKGHVVAQSLLGTMYSAGQGLPKDDQQAAFWTRKAAEQGYAVSQSMLGAMYAGGKGVPRDDQEALAWYRKAADQGDVVGELGLGSTYFNGQGVPQDDQQASFWFRKAADQGNALSQTMLGYMYTVGRGVPQDDRQALAWTRKAAEQGYAKAQFNLGVMYSDGRGVPKDDREALAWFHKAAEQGDAEAVSEINRRRSSSRR